MSIDVRMLMIAGAILALLQTFGMGVLWSLNRRLPGIGYWTASTILYAICSPLFAMQWMHGPRLLLFVVPNVMSAAAAVCFYVGACRFTEQPVRKRVLFSVHGVGLLVFLYFLYVDGNQPARIHLMSLLVGFSYAMTAATLWGERRPGLKFSTRFTAVAFGVCALSMVYRLIALWSNEQLGGTMENSVTNLVVTLFAMAMAYFWTFCIVLLVNQHQAKEISDRMTAQFSIEEELLKAKNEVEKHRSLRLRQLMVRDLHDGIGGITATLAMLASLGREEMGGEREELLKHIETIALEGSREVRALMGSLENGVLRWDEWLADLRDYARKAAGIPLEWQVEGVVPEGVIDDTAAAISLMRAVKESVHNVARHAQANRMRMHFRFEEERLSLTIEDDGGGFVKPREGGRGLKNMHRRADDLGGSFSLKGGEGTTAAFVIPMPLKYVEERLVREA